MALGLGGAPISLGPGGRIAAAILSILPVLALSWGLLRLAVTLRMFGGGAPFSTEAADGLRDFGAGVIGCALLKPLAATALILLLTWSGPGPTSLAIGVSSETLLLLLLGAVMTMLGWALGEAALLADENAQFV